MDRRLRVHKHHQEKFAQNIDVDILNFNKILKIIKFYKIDLVIVGPEEPLVRGLVYFLTKKKN